jgi:hypothetical protein
VRAGQGRAGQGRAGQGRAGHGRAGEGKGVWGHWIPMSSALYYLIYVHS